MKILILVRHAKAEDKAEPEQDIERNLTVEGIRDAGAMGERLHVMKINPDALVSSPANRAMQTAEVIHDKISSKKEIVTDKEIYNARSATLLRIIKKFNSSFKTVMLVGHNPSFTSLLDTLCEANIKNIPKGGIVGIKLKVDAWSNVDKKCGTLMFFDSPKNK